ncbi:MAG: BACON domain-containing protein [Bacteroidales bacterium]|nr:BACON domain-containing protein [Bacteroidales bacterium]
MKKLLYILAAALCTLAFNSCQEEEIVEPAAKINIISSNLSIPAKGGRAMVILAKEWKGTATVEADWCSYDTHKDTVFFYAEENNALESRYAKVTLSLEDEDATITVQQFGFRTSGFEVKDISINEDAKTFNFPYTYDEMMVATTEADWITLTVTKDNLKVDIAKNETPATKTEKSRKAEIKWSLGIDSGVIAVEQLNIGFMQPDANWTVAYDGYKDYEGDNYEHITNTVADPTVSGMYWITYFTKDDFSKSGLKVGDYIATLVPGIKDELDEIIDYYAADYPGLTYSDLLFTESDFQIFDKFANGDYYACAVGLDENAELTGHYAVAEFTIARGGSDASGYDAWLGEWTCPHGTSKTKTDTWTITAKDKGYTYYVTGIEGRDFVVEAEYDEETEALLMIAQEEVGTFTSSKYGECVAGFYGATSSGNFYRAETNPYTIMYATMDGDEAQFAPATLKTQDNGDWQPEIAAFIGQNEAGNYVLPGAFSDATLTTAKIVRKGGSSGGDDPVEGSAAYKKFLGGWTVNPADATRDPWTANILANETDKSYQIYDWQDWSDDWAEPMDANFKDNKIYLMGGTGKPLAENVSLDDPDDPFDIYYMGSAEIDGQSYVITSGENMYEACVGDFDKDGNIVLTGLNVNLSDGGTYPFIEFGVVAMSQNEDGPIYTFLNEAGPFPVTMLKGSSTSSMKTLGYEWHPAISTMKKVKAMEMKSCEEEITLVAHEAILIPVKALKFRTK